MNIFIFVEIVLKVGVSYICSHLVYLHKKHLKKFHQQKAFLWRFDIEICVYLLCHYYKAQFYTQFLHFYDVFVFFNIRGLFFNFYLLQTKFLVGIKSRLKRKRNNETLISFIKSVPKTRSTKRKTPRTNSTRIGRDTISPRAWAGARKPYLYLQGCCDARGIQNRLPWLSNLIFNQTLLQLRIEIVVSRNCEISPAASP